MTAYTITPKYISKKLFEIYENNGKKRIVYADQELLEKLFQEDQIREYKLIAIECLKEFNQR